RKVLGASVTELLLLLSRDSVRLVALAFLVGAPLAYLGMSRWLQDFAFRIDLSLTTFLLTGLGALLLSWLTVSFQILRLARANPARLLRSE
ncbi:MAG: ABC transporter permease, partial [Rhodothermales bacterium]|nr:ABC transporter permease [Rhodothermales bacterium]